MIQAKCIKIIKNTKGNIIKFVLADTDGNTKEVTPDKLKTAIKTGKINVVNLKLKQDKNKLIEKEKIETYIRNAKAFGYKVEEIKTKCNHLCYLVSKSDTEHILHIPDDVTNCYELLTHSTIKGKLTVIGASNVTNMKEMFDGCKNLQSLDLSNFDTSKVIDMSFMFYCCKSLQSLDLSNFDTSNVINMSCIFYCCKSLQSLDLSNFDTSNVRDMTEMFDACSSLKSLDLSSFDTSNVTDMRLMFCDCSSLKSLELSNFNTSKVMYMHSMFNGCSNLESLDLSSFGLSKVTSMENMFRNCNAKVKTKDARIIKAYPDLCI